MTLTQTGGGNGSSAEAVGSGESHEGFPLLVLGAIGVVFGDVGTSPIYAFRQAIAAVGVETPGRAEVLGLLSLILWSLTAVVTIKYVGLVTRADNKGEGGTLSLMALARSTFLTRPKWILWLGMASAALFLGDAIITPAISVLSAVEGLEVVSPALDEWVLPITIVILIGLFMFQRFGTARVAAVFGPVTSVWFACLGLLGLQRIIAAPEVLLAINPVLAVTFMTSHLGVAAAVMGAAFLAVTGGEALYTDLGHFGRKPIVTAWLFLVFPCLLLNYFGQGAFVLSHPSGAGNPFFEMQPHWARIPLLVLATAATVIASQAVITGAYSLVRQAVNLNLLPRMRVQHTSETQSGQVYMPQINSFLLIAVLMLVLGFESSQALASTYGLAVSGVMVIDITLLFVVMWRRWRWPLFVAVLVAAPFVAMDLWFVIANSVKFLQGGWVPTLVAVALCTIMVTWTQGRQRLLEKTRRNEIPLTDLIRNLSENPPTTVSGTAVFLTNDVHGAPAALLHSLKHYKVLHENNVILTVITSAAPTVPDDEKVKIEVFNAMFSRVMITFGYMEDPNIPKALALCRKLGWKYDIMSTSFFLSRRSIRPSPKGGMPYWQDRLFIALAKNATDATEYFAIPTGRVVEIGTQLTI
ncbi:MAG TPA: potassium transporter Kup [Devosiaceae bacterium]